MITFLIVAAFIWQKYCRYGVKHYIFNQSETFSARNLLVVNVQTVMISLQCLMYMEFNNFFQECDFTTKYLFYSFTCFTHFCNTVISFSHAYFPNMVLITLCFSFCIVSQVKSKNGKVVSGQEGNCEPYIKINSTNTQKKTASGWQSIHDFNTF